MGRSERRGDLQPLSSLCCPTLAFILSAQEFKLLERKFDDHGDGFVNYVQFACAVDSEELSSNRADNSLAGVMHKFRTNVNFKTDKVGVRRKGGQEGIGC